MITDAGRVKLQGEIERVLWNNEPYPPLDLCMRLARKVVDMVSKHG